jgi:DNA-binding NarL/FixJ family response regulator
MPPARTGRSGPTRARRRCWPTEPQPSGCSGRPSSDCHGSAPERRWLARLAADGQTNPEIGAQLFLSPGTVEWHLTRVFSKLGISSRKQLGSALSDVGAAVARR